MIVPIRCPENRLPELKNLDKRYPLRDGVATLSKLAFSKERDKIVESEKKRLGDKYIKHDDFSVGGTVHTLVFHYHTKERTATITDMSDLVVALRDTGLVLGFDGNDLVLMERN